jgi:phage major head subunit gpT-like protein
MAIITNPLLQALRTSFDSSFQKGLDDAGSQYKDVATVIESSSSSNDYGWLGSMPDLVEWVGDRPMTDIKEFGYQIFNKTWANGVNIKRDSIEDDNLGMYAPLLQMLGRNAALFPDKQIFPLFTNGFDAPCYDGQNFFDTDHPVYPNTDGTGAAASVANVFMQSEDWTGLSWYLLDLSKPLRPVIWQDRRPVATTAITAPDADTVFRTNSYAYGCDLRGNAGYGFWQMAYCGLADLTSDNLWTVFEAMTQIQGDGGRELDITPTHLLVPKGLRKQATQLLEREFIATENGTVSNEWNGSKLELIVGAYL